MAKAKKKRKAKWRWLRYRKGDQAHNLQCAAQQWIHSRGGTAVVLGPIGLLYQGGGKYQVCVGALGVMPDRSAKAKKRRK